MISRAKETSLIVRFADERPQDNYTGICEYRQKLRNLNTIDPGILGAIGSGMGSARLQALHLLYAERAAIHSIMQIECRKSFNVLANEQRWLQYYQSINYQAIAEKVLVTAFVICLLFVIAASNANANLNTKPDNPRQYFTDGETVEPLAARGHVWRQPVTSPELASGVAPGHRPLLTTRISLLTTRLGDAPSRTGIGVYDDRKTASQSVAGRLNNTWLQSTGSEACISMLSKVELRDDTALLQVNEVSRYALVEKVPQPRETDRVKSGHFAPSTPKGLMHVQRSASAGYDNLRGKRPAMTAGGEPAPPCHLPPWVGMLTEFMPAHSPARCGWGVLR